MSLLTTITFEGNDPTRFLQSQLTSDVDKASTLSLTALCNQKGRVLATGWFIHHPARLYVATSLAHTIAKHLNQYARFNQIECKVGDEMFLTHEATNLKLLNGISISASASLDVNAQKLLLIENGIPLIEEKTHGAYTPHMLNLPKLGAINFEKGCYLGQEIIARTEHLGQSKRLLYRGLLEGTCPDLQDEVHQDAKRVGTIAMHASLNEHRHHILFVGPRNLSHSPLQAQSKDGRMHGDITLI